MTKRRKPFAERLRTGLGEALAHARGELTLHTVEHIDGPPDIDGPTLAAVRKQADMSQAVFAKMLSTSLKTVQSWEQGTRTPSPAARRLIQLFVSEPATMCRVVGLPKIVFSGFEVKMLPRGQRHIVRAGT